MIRFTASCKRERQVAPGHVVTCDETFTDPAAFEAHMTGAHGARKLAGPSKAAGKPYPWKAPKVPADHEEALARIIAANPDDVVDVDIPGAVSDGLWRYDQDTDVPAHVLPRTVRPILEGAIDRGEPWLVQVDGPRVRLEVMRPSPTGEPGTTTAARVTILEGKVRQVETVDPSRDLAPTGWWADKITRARELFPAPGEVVVPAA